MESKPKEKCFFAFVELAGDEKEDDRLNGDRISSGIIIIQANKRPLLRGSSLSLTEKSKEHSAVDCKVSEGNLTSLRGKNQCCHWGWTDDCVMVGRWDE